MAFLLEKGEDLSRRKRDCFELRLRGNDESVVLLPIESLSVDLIVSTIPFLWGPHRSFVRLLFRVSEASHVRGRDVDVTACLAPSQQLSLSATLSLGECVALSNCHFACEAERAKGR